MECLFLKIFAQLSTEMTLLQYISYSTQHGYKFVQDKGGNRPHASYIGNFQISFMWTHFQNQFSPKICSGQIYQTNF